MKYIVFFALLSTHAFSTLNICGELESVNDFHFSAGKVQYINIETENYKHDNVTIYTLKDIYYFIDALYSVEKNIPNLPYDNIRLGKDVKYTEANFWDELFGRDVDPYRSGMKYIYKLEHVYFVCAQFNQPQREFKFTEVEKIELYQKTKDSLHLLYSRDGEHVNIQYE